MANSRFDYSALKPLKQNQGWNPDLLSPVEPEKEDENQYMPPQTKGISGIAKDVSGLPGAAISGVTDYATKLPEEASQSWEQIFSNPKRAALNVATGAGEAVKGAFNAPYHLAQYLKSKDIPWFKQTADYVPHVGDTGLEKALGLSDRQPGDKLLREVAMFAPLGRAGALQKLERATGIISPKVANVAERSKDIASYGGLQKKLEELQGIAKERESQVASASEAEKGALEGLERVEQEGSKDVGKYLNEGAAHAVRGASSLARRIGSIENYWKEGFRDLRKNLKDSRFAMDKLPEFGSDMQHVISNIKDLEVRNGKFYIKGQPEVSRELRDIINKAPTPKDVLADDFLTKYQDFRDARYDLLQRAKTADNASERKAMFKAYEESKPVEASVKKALEEGLGEHREEFDRVNKGYSEQVYPLRANKVAAKAMKGKLGPNTMEDLAGFGEGQELVRELVKQDPELLRNIVGQRYAAKPSALHDINETTAEYLNEMPELKNIMQENEKRLSQQLKEVTKHKEQKEISLKKKLELENQAKELQKRIDRIRKDRQRIWKTTKNVVKAGGAVLIGAPIINRLISKYTGS